MQLWVVVDDDANAIQLHAGRSPRARHGIYRSSPTNYNARVKCVNRLPCIGLLTTTHADSRQAGGQTIASRYNGIARYDMPVCNNMRLESDGDPQPDYSTYHTTAELRSNKEINYTTRKKRWA